MMEWEIIRQPGGGATAAGSRLSNQVMGGPANYEVAK